MFYERAQDYIRDVLSGKEIVCEYVRQAVERHVRDLADQGPKRGIWFDEESARLYLSAISLFKHTRGLEFAGKPFDAQPFQCFTFMSIFGWKRYDEGVKTPYRRFTRVYKETAKKSGKSEESALLAWLCLLFDGEYGAQIYSAATKVDQAKIVFAACSSMGKFLKRDSKRLDKMINRNNVRVYIEETESFIQALSSDYHGIDGIDTHVGIIDEFHAHKDSLVSDSIRNSMAARLQPILFTITTAGFNLQYPCYQVARKEAVAVLNGTIQDDSLFALIFTLDTQPYTAKYDFIQSIHQIHKECSLGFAKTIQTGSTSTMDFVAHATTRIIEKIGQDVAKIIQKEKLGQEGFADHATNKKGLMQTQAESSVQLKSGESGLSPTKKALLVHKKDGKQKTGDTTLITLERTSTELHQSNTIHFTPNKTEDAPFVRLIEKLYVSIIATLQERFVGFFVHNAIQQLVCSAILNHLLEEHSNTCSFQNYKIEDGWLLIKCDADDWRDPKNWIKANPNIGRTVKLKNMTDLFAAAVNGGPMREVDFMTKNLNVWVASQYNWIGDDIFMECKGDYNLKDQQDRQVMCWGGMDLGQTSDMTCFAQLFDPDQNDGKYIFILYTWLCEETYRKRIEQGEPHAQWVRDGELEITPGNTTDYGYLEQRIIDIQRNYNLVNVGYDVANSSQTAIKLENEGVILEQFSQGILNMNNPTKELAKHFYDRNVIHNGNGLMRFMFQSVEIVRDSTGNIKVSKKDPNRKVDGVVAMVMALGQYMEWKGINGNMYKEGFRFL